MAKMKEQKELLRLRGELLGSDGFETLTIPQLRKTGEILGNLVGRGVKVDSIHIYDGSVFIETTGETTDDFLVQYFEIVGPSGDHRHIDPLEDGNGRERV